MKDKISLAGDLGSGKSTVAKILISELGAEYYSTGAIVRSIAEKRGMTVTELNVYMETHPEIDHEIDDGLAALGELDKFLIIDSRLAWHFTKGTFRVYLSTDVETSALRIMNDNRTGEHSSTLEETVKETRRRRESEKKRYMEQYGLDIKNLENYSLIVDTTNATPKEVADRIISSFNLWKSNKDYTAVFVTPDRLNYPDITPDAEKISRLASQLDEGIDIPEVTVFECDGELYLFGGLESALAYGLNMNTFVPARLVTGSTEGKTYVKMKNSL